MNEDNNFEVSLDDRAQKEIPNHDPSPTTSPISEVINDPSPITSPISEVINDSDTSAPIPEPISDSADSINYYSQRGMSNKKASNIRVPTTHTLVHKSQLNRLKKKAENYDSLM